MEQIGEDTVAKKAYGYTRVSTEEQVKDGNSLTSHREVRRGSQYRDSGLVNR